MPLTRRPLLFALAAALVAPAALRAHDGNVVVEGHTYAGRAQVAGNDLLLNGTGVRAVAWFKGYSAALYLRAKSTTAAQAVALGGAKRLQLRMLHDVPAQEFTKAFRKGLERNAAAEELPALGERMRRFEALIDAVGTVRKGDLINLDFEPGRGTAFTLNGKLRGEVIAGDDFYGALLRSFVGEKPYDRELRAGLLGRRP